MTDGAVPDGGSQESLSYEQARDRLGLAVQEMTNLKIARQSESPEQRVANVWNRLQLQIIQREAEALINKP